MQKSFYFLSPVEVVKVTSHNLQEVAEWCGGSVQETESRRVPGRMDQYVWVPTPKGTNISWAFPGMFITKRLVISAKNELRATWAVFRRDYFDKNYFGTPQAAADKTWEREAAERNKPAKVEVVSHIKDAMNEAMARVKKAAEKAGLDERQAEAIVVDFKTTAEEAIVEAESEIPEEDLSTKVIEIKDAMNVEASLVAEEPKPVDEVEQIKHAHASTEKCRGNGCGADRFSDGLHIFTDVDILARDEDSENEVVEKDPEDIDPESVEILDPDTHDLDPRQEQVFSG